MESCRIFLAGNSIRKRGDGYVAKRTSERRASNRRTSGSKSESSEASSKTTGELPASCLVFNKPGGTTTSDINDLYVPFRLLFRADTVFKGTNTYRQFPYPHRSITPHVYPTILPLPLNARFDSSLLNQGEFWGCTDFESGAEQLTRGMLQLLGRPDRLSDMVSRSRCLTTVIRFAADPMRIPNRLVGNREESDGQSG